MCNDCESKPVYKITAELYDGVVVSHMAVGDPELSMVAEQLDNDGDVVWWDFDEI